MSISTRTRFEVFKRDGFACQYCGRTPPEVTLHVDHITPVAAGGPDDPLNLVTACADCNLGKAAVPLGQVSRPLAEQIAEERDRQEQMAAFNAFLAEQRGAELAEVEGLGRRWYNAFARTSAQRDRWVFGPRRVPSIRTFLSRLPRVRIEEAMDIAGGRIYATTRGGDEKRWRYFCGVCWRMIREHDGG